MLETQNLSNTGMSSHILPGGNNREFARISKKYQALARQNAELQARYDEKCDEVTKLQFDNEMTKTKIETSETRVKQMMLENEKLMQDNTNRTPDSTSQAQALSEESFRKKFKSMTGELEMFDAFTETFYQLFIALPFVKSQARNEITKIR